MGWCRRRLVDTSWFRHRLQNSSWFQRANTPPPDGAASCHHDAALAFGTLCSSQGAWRAASGGSTHASTGLPVRGRLPRWCAAHRDLTHPSSVPPRSRAAIRGSRNRRSLEACGGGRNVACALSCCQPGAVPRSRVRGPRVASGRKSQRTRGPRRVQPGGAGSGSSTSTVKLCCMRSGLSVRRACGTLPDRSAILQLVAGRPTRSGGIGASNGEFSHERRACHHTTEERPCRPEARPRRTSRSS